jgi:SAM-dependent methyltransferase
MFSPELRISECMTPYFVARQLSRPMGFPGWIIERLMNVRNAQMNAFAVDLLELRQSDDVLEIGFGGGVNLATLIKRSRSVAGVDHSPDVVRRASARFRGYVRSGRVVFREGRVESIPFESGRFHKICTREYALFLALARGRVSGTPSCARARRQTGNRLPSEAMDGSYGIPFRYLYLANV